MDYEKLMDFVREYTFLIHDINNNKYSDIRKRDAAWEEISKKLKVQKKQCKKALTLVRNFRRTVKNQKEARSGQTNVISKKQKCQDELSFFVPFAKERPTLCTITTHGESTTRDKDHNHDDCDVSLDGEGSALSVDHPPDEALPDSDVSTLSAATTATPMIRLSGRSRRTLFEKSASEETFSTALMKYTLEDKKLNDIEQFFASMTAIVKSFPPQERVLAKAKVFEVISKIEIDILSDSTSSIQSSTFFHSNGFRQNSYTARSTFAPVQMPQTHNDFQRTPPTPISKSSNDFY